MGLNYSQSKALGLGHLHPAAAGKSDREILRELGVEIELPKKPAKYRNVRTEYRGVKYDSKAEAERAEQLDYLKRCAYVKWWIGQPKFHLGCPENVYVADFFVMTAIPAHHYVEDVKGFWTKKFKHDVKLWRQYGPCDLHIISGKDVQVIEGGKQ